MDYPDYIILRIRLYYVLPGWGVWVLWIIRIILDYGLILNTYCRTLNGVLTLKEGDVVAAA